MTPFKDVAHQNKKAQWKYFDKKMNVGPKLQKHTVITVVH